jgi:hypothetical protein
MTVHFGQFGLQTRHFGLQKGREITERAHLSAPGMYEGNLFLDSAQLRFFAVRAVIEGGGDEFMDRRRITPVVEEFEHTPEGE